MKKPFIWTHISIFILALCALLNYIKSLEHKNQNQENKVEQKTMRKTRKDINNFKIIQAIVWQAQNVNF